MSESLHGKTIQQLIDQGWILLTDEYSYELVGLRSVIWHWNSMTWAEANLLRREIRIQSKWDTRHSLLSTDPEGRFIWALLEYSFKQGHRRSRK